MARPSHAVGRKKRLGSVPVIDLEDVRLARIAQRRFGVSPTVVVSALEELEDSSRALDMIQVLQGRSLLTEEQTTELLRIRDSGRPGGLKLVSVLGKGASSTELRRARSPVTCATLR